MRQLLSFASVAAAAAVVFLLPSASSQASEGGISFETPSVADPIHTYGEPDIGIDALGRVFVSGPTGTGTQRSVWNGSVDGGHTFRVITPGVPPTAIQSIEDPPGGGDTDINFDRSGKQYFVDLYALSCNRVATTSDGGATVEQNFLGCGGNFGSDRPWLAVYDPPPGTPHDSAYAGPTPLVYQEYNNLVGPGPDGGAQWDKSNDGLNYTNALNGVTPATEAVYSRSARTATRRSTSRRERCSRRPATPTATALTTCCSTSAPRMRRATSPSSTRRPPPATAPTTRT